MFSSEAERRKFSQAASAEILKKMPVDTGQVLSALYSRAKSYRIVRKEVECPLGIFRIYASTIRGVATSILLPSGMSVNFFSTFSFSVQVRIMSS